MKIDIVKLMFEDEESIKIANIHKCCDKILNSEVIEFISDYGEEVGIKLINKTSSYIDREYMEFNNYENINYCPFCGNKIEITLIDTIDETEQYINTVNQIEQLRTRANETDSKSETAMLNKQILELNKKIDYFYNNDKLKNWKKRN